MSDTLCVSAYSRRPLNRRVFTSASAADKHFTELKKSGQYQAILVVRKYRVNGELVQECVRSYLHKQIRCMPTYGKGRVKVRLHNAMARHRLDN